MFRHIYVNAFFLLFCFVQFTSVCLELKEKHVVNIDISIIYW